MHTHADGVHSLTAPQRFLGVEVGARMTLLETDHGVVVHSPIGVDPSVVDAVGPFSAIVSPNRLHHLYAAPWLEHAPGWAAPGLADKRPDLAFTGTLEPGVQPFGPEIEAYPLACFPLTNEVVLLHRPSRTLVVTDLVFNFGPDAPLFTRFAMTLAGGYPGCRTSLLEKVGFKRAIARREMAALAELDFDRLVMAHGHVIETGGKAAFRRAMRWLGA